ncbi:glycosyltransferase family 2 protein [Streptococcus entericus]|uniref:glycosyltransferase family 2 protein n=1 Tax=Streptococcus entericus TaxID=155680 RepID=UPI00037D0E5E|nr:glycosyltransferase family 2 protein [Streptococcus entericus]
MEHLISVIIPVFKVEEYIEDCINSVLAQTYTNLEILIVDDGSPDKSIELAKKMTKDDSRVRYLVKPNGGLSDARNMGIKEAKGEFITFIDSDDYISPTYVETLHRLLTEQKADISAIALRQDVDGQLKSLVDARNYLRVFSPKDILLAMYEKKDYFVVSLTVAQGKLYKKELFDNILYPVGKKYEDSFTTYKLYKASEKIVYLNEELYYYRIRQGSITNSGFSLSNLDKLEMFEEKLDYLSEYSEVIKKVRYAYCIELIRAAYYLRNIEDAQERRNDIVERHKHLFWKVFSESDIKQRLKLVAYRYFPSIVIYLSNRG